MDNDSVQLIGGPCGQHGPYTFYKAFKYVNKDGIKRIMTLSEFFFVKLWMDSDLVCIGELQLLWIDKNSEQVLASLRLYFLPENTPEGRMDHGEDEVLAISEKVVLRVEDLITWITADAEWTWGRLGRMCLKGNNEDGISHFLPYSDSSLDFSDIEKERKALDTNSDKESSVIILSYPRYCRYRSVMKRLEGVEDEYLKHKLVNALGGFSVPSRHTRILFCRDTFDYPELEGHELLCNHLAPKLKGRPRGKRKKRSLSPGSESNESECSISNIAGTSQYATPSTSNCNVVASVSKIGNEGYINGYRKDRGTISTRRSTRSGDTTEGKVFLRQLTSFMKTNHTPIGRIPSLGYRELDLHIFFMKVQKFGGYDIVTTNRLWKSIFDDLGGNHGSTSAATVIRRHYERFLLPYERHIKGEEYKPLPISERRRLKNKVNRNSVSDAETSEGTSGSDNSTPTPHSLAPTQFTSDNGAGESKDNPDKMKTSSLRSIRVKPERLRESGKIKIESAVKEPVVEIENVPLKTEPKEEVDEKPKLPMLPDIKDAEPTTTAVAPIQKVETEETLSPIESKDIPIVEIKEEKEKENEAVQIIEIPPKDEMSFKDVIELNSTDAYKTITTANHTTTGETVITEVKKQKLDILKQGGLEVTPVRSVANNQNKESRPSVIQTAIAHRAEIIPNDVKINEDKKQMPPPPQLATLTKRSAVHIPPPVIPTIPSISTISTPITPSKPPSLGSKTFTFGKRSPPKVLQSKSIYSPCGETIYGDPKDFFQPTLQNIQTPKFVKTAKVPQTGILDLTVKSPQKPLVQPSPHNIKNTHLVIPSPFPLLDHKKVGSNLEITLVGANDSKSTIPHNHYFNASKQRPTFNPPPPLNSPLPKRRSNAGNYMTSKLAKMEDKIRNTIYSTQMYPPRDVKKGDFEPTPNKQYKIENNPPVTKAQLPHPQPAAKQPYAPPPAMFTMSNYINSIPKGVPPFMPMDPSLYYLQSMYSPLNLPPMPLISSPDSLQLYTEILAQSSRSRMQFPFAQDNSSMASTDNCKK